MDIDAEPGASVFLVVSGRSTPLVVNGTVVAVEDGRITVDLEDASSVTPQEPSSSPALSQAAGDRRVHPRYPTWLDATIYSRSCPQGRPAVITDLSVQGASVETGEWEGDAFYRLVLEVNGRDLVIECECIHQEGTWRGVLMHTRFVLLSREQYEILEAVVAALRSIFGEAQESLAHDRLGAAIA